MFKTGNWKSIHNCSLTKQRYDFSAVIPFWCNPSEIYFTTSFSLAYHRRRAFLSNRNLAPPGFAAVLASSFLRPCLACTEMGICIYTCSIVTFKLCKHCVYIYVGQHWTTIYCRMAVKILASSRMMNVRGKNLSRSLSGSISQTLFCLPLMICTRVILCIVYDDVVVVELIDSVLQKKSLTATTCHLCVDVTFWLLLLRIFGVIF